MSWIVSIIIDSLVLYGLFRLLQIMGERGILYATPRANQYALVVMRGDNKDDSEGGNVVDVIHAIPGKKLIKPNEDQFGWYYEPGVEERGFLFDNFGIIWLGPYRTLRTNKIRSIRFARKDGETTYHLMPKDDDRVWVHHSGQHDVEITDAETAGAIRLDLKLNLHTEDKFPVRARLKVADSTAMLTIMAKAKAIGFTGPFEAEAFLGGKEENKQNLERAVQSISGAVEEAVGISVTKVDLFDVDMDKRTRSVLQQVAEAKRKAEAELEQATVRVDTAKKEAEADIARAEGRKQAKIKDNDAEVDFLDRVMREVSANPAMVEIYRARAYQENKTVTVYAPGAGGFVPLAGNGGVWQRAS